jgi:hypothetical protein
MTRGAMSLTCAGFLHSSHELTGTKMARCSAKRGYVALICSVSYFMKLSVAVLHSAGQ